MKLDFLNDNDVAMKVFNDYSGIALTALVTNRIMFYHHEGFITDEEFLSSKELVVLSQLLSI